MRYAVLPNMMLQSDGRLRRPQLNIGCWADLTRDQWRIVDY
jgi:hypothetical protein